MSPSVNPQILAKIRSFPAMSRSASRVLELMGESDCDASRLERELRGDPGLTANLLKAANSPYFGFSGSISSTRDAVVRLGTRRVFQLVVASSVHAVMEAELPGYDAEPGELWRHSVAVSIASETIAGALGLAEQEQAFTAGLLHDLGKLALGEFICRKRNRVTAALGSETSYEAAELAALGVDHSEVGARILETWSFPEALVMVVRWHHRPDDLEPSIPLVDVVHVADVLCLSLGCSEGREDLQYRMSSAAIERLGLRREQLDAAAIDTMEGLAGMNGALL